MLISNATKVPSCWNHEELINWSVFRRTRVHLFHSSFVKMSTWMILICHLSPT